MRAPVLAVGDGALDFWKAIRDVFPQTREQRCWWHKIGNVLAALPKSKDPTNQEEIRKPRDTPLGRRSWGRVRVGSAYARS